MFGISWSEFFLIALVFVILINPGDIPEILKNIRLFLANITKIKNHFTDIVKEFEKDPEIERLKQQARIDFTSFSKEYLEPIDQLDMKKEKLPKNDQA